MMVMHNDLLFFLSCNPHREEIDRFKNSKEIVSIYRVCGVEPWLIVCKTASIRDILKLNHEYKLNIKYMSITSSPNLLGGGKLSGDKNKLISWIFIKGENLSSRDDFIEFLNEMNDFEISQAYPIFGEYNFILKIHTSGIGDVDKFLIRCHEENISTSTKCVLTVLKDESTLSKSNIEEKRTEAAEIKKEWSYAIARVMANTKGFIQKSKEEQKRCLDDKLRSMRIPIPSDQIGRFLLNPELEKDEYSRHELEHPNKLIDRYSIKLERGGWLKVLFFFRATSGKKTELEETLTGELLGVGPDQFSRKLYHMTGDYDFIVPFDCKDMDALNKAINNFLRKHGELIESFTNTVCLPGKIEEKGLLDALDLPLIGALLINATQIDAFEKKIRDIFSSVLKEDLFMAKEGVSPREGYVISRINKEFRPQFQDSKEDFKESIKDYQRRFTTFENIGIESTIEFEDCRLIQNLLKFHFTNPDKKSAFLSEVRRKMGDCEIIGVIYEPVRDPLTVMCILMVKDLVELQVLIDEFRKYCRKIEFHVIFHQKYYSKTIEDRVRCRPCFYPVDRPSQNCGNCIRYILPRKRDRILNVDFEKKLKPDITINLVGIDMSLSQYFALEESLDHEEKRKEIFENYGQRDYFGSPEDVFREYDELVRNKENYRSRYKNAILEVIKDADCDILLFPEYSIPLNIYNQIKEEIKQICIEKKCVIIGGTHIDKDGFNVCPVFIFRDDGEKGRCEIYHLYKNNRSPFEEGLNLMRHGGTAHLKFLNTIWGNVYVQICYDAYTVGGEFENVDVLLVPSFNPSKSYKRTIRDKAQNYVLVAGYANTTNEEELETDFFYPSRKASQRDRKPLHKEQWPKGAKISEEAIFKLSEESKRVEEFNIRIKRIDFNLIQLDLIRELYSIRNANNR